MNSMRSLLVKTPAALALLAALQAAGSTFTVQSSENTFTITRSGSGTNAAETVRYRTVSLSAFAGTHFTAATGTLAFAAGQTTTNITVSETAISSISTSSPYRYQSGTSRSYRFEINNWNGGHIAKWDRSITYGEDCQFKTNKINRSITDLVYFGNSAYRSGMPAAKYLDVSYTPPSGDVQGSNQDLPGYVLIDDSYNYSKKPATVGTSSLIGTTGVPASYLYDRGYKIYATVCFSMKELDDGYQFVQIIAGNSAASYDGADDNKIVNDPVNSIYKACFELEKGSDCYDGKQFFPHRYNYADRSAGNQDQFHTEFYRPNGYLWQHKFKTHSPSYRASESGSVVLPVTTSYITTRFDCCGKDNDTWGYKDLFVRMALVDATAPTLFGSSTTAIAVDPGPHYPGGTFYISVPFNEIVVTSGSPTLSTSWGTATCESGSGSNVLTYKGTITAGIGTQLRITSSNGASTIKDLMENPFAGSSTSMNKNFGGVAVDFVPWTGAGTAADPYVITTTNQLNYLA